MEGEKVSPSLSNLPSFYTLHKEEYIELVTLLNILNSYDNQLWYMENLR